MVCRSAKSAANLGQYGSNRTPDRGWVKPGRKRRLGDAFASSSTVCSLSRAGRPSSSARKASARALRPGHRRAARAGSRPAPPGWGADRSRPAVRLAARSAPGRARWWSRRGATGRDQDDGGHYPSALRTIVSRSCAASAAMAAATESSTSTSTRKLLPSALPCGAVTGRPRTVHRDRGRRPSGRAPPPAGRGCPAAWSGWVSPRCASFRPMWVWPGATACAPIEFGPTRDPAGRSVWAYCPIRDAALSAGTTATPVARPTSWWSGRRLDLPLRAPRPWPAPTPVGVPAPGSPAADARAPMHTHSTPTMIRRVLRRARNCTPDGRVGRLGRRRLCRSALGQVCRIGHRACLFCCFGVRVEQHEHHTPDTGQYPTPVDNSGIWRGRVPRSTGKHHPAEPARSTSTITLLEIATKASRPALAGVTHSHGSERWKRWCRGGAFALRSHAAGIALMPLIPATAHRWEGLALPVGHRTRPGHPGRHLGRIPAQLEPGRSRPVRVRAVHPAVVLAVRRLRWPVPAR